MFEGWKKPRRSRVVIGGDPEAERRAEELSEKVAAEHAGVASEQENLRAVITPEVQQSLVGIFTGMVARSGISIEHSNVGALKQEPLFTDNAAGDAHYNYEANRIVVNVGDAKGIDTNAMVEAAYESAKRLSLIEGSKRLADARILRLLSVHVHENMHAMGRVFVDKNAYNRKSLLIELFGTLRVWRLFKKRTVWEFGIAKICKDDLGNTEESNKIAMEGLTDLMAYLVADELNVRHGLGLDTDFYFNELIPARERQAFSYASYTFIMMNVVKLLSERARVPLESMMMSFVRAYYFGDDFYKKETKALMEQHLGRGFWEDLARIGIPKDEKGNRVMDGESRVFIQKWGFGDVESGFKTLLDELRGLRMFASY